MYDNVYVALTNGIGNKPQQSTDTTTPNYYKIYTATAIIVLHTSHVIFDQVLGYM